MSDIYGYGPVGALGGINPMGSVMADPLMNTPQARPFKPYGYGMTQQGLVQALGAASPDELAPEQGGKPSGKDPIADGAAALAAAIKNYNPGVKVNPNDPLTWNQPAQGGLQAIQGMQGLPNFSGTFAGS